MRGWGVLAAMALIAGWMDTAAAQSAEKVEIIVSNNRAEEVTMKFEYAFRDYTWKLIEQAVKANGEITYRFPANIPGCERLRNWHITDGILSISNAKGLICEKRISLCDRVQMSMEVGRSSCYWRAE
jgi:hypothetical protein